MIGKIKGKLKHTIKCNKVGKLKELRWGFRPQNLDFFRGNSWSTFKPGFQALDPISTSISAKIYNLCTKKL